MIFGRKKIGLALGSGGTRGFAHVGVIKALEANDIPIDFIAGTSAGAIVGGAYAMEKKLSKIETFISELPYWEMAKSFSDVNLKEGIVKGEKFLELLSGLVSDAVIEKCIIPFTAVAADRITGEEVLITKGSLAESLRASSSIPIVFSPYTTDTGSELIDGGVVQQVPVETVKRMGADIVIAVNLSEKIESYNPKSNISMMQHYMLLLFKSIARENVRSADIVISPHFTEADWFSNLKDRDALIAEGEKVTLESIAAIKKLL